MKFWILAEEKKKEEQAQLVFIFTNRKTADQEISSLRQTKKEIKKRVFDKGQEYTDLE